PQHVEDDVPAERRPARERDVGTGGLVGRHTPRSVFHAARHGLRPRHARRKRPCDFQSRPALSGHAWYATPVGMIAPVSRSLNRPKYFSTAATARGRLEAADLTKARTSFKDSPPASP